MVKALILDDVAISYLQVSDSLGAAWLENFSVKAGDKRIRTVDLDGMVYILSDRASSASKLAVFLIEDGLLFSVIPRAYRLEAFRRALRGCMRIFDPSIAIPSSWKPYHKQGLYFSFQSNGLGTGIKARIHIDHRGKNAGHVFVYYLGVVDPYRENPESVYEVFEAAFAGYKKAIVAPQRITVDPSNQQSEDGDRSVLDLSGHLDEEITQGLSVERWYKTKLTAKQRRFIDLPSHQSIRLQGPAGTGKTLAMVVKCLLLAHSAIDDNKPLRIAYLTHSLTTADLVRQVIGAIDDRGVLFLGSDKFGLVITTLQSLATNALAYDLGGLEVLSHDGLEGRKMQLELIQSLVESYKLNNWIAMKDQCSEPFRRYVDEEKNSPAKLYFVYQLMNEFACVLDAEGVRDNPDKRQQYLSEKRLKWMMTLESEGERQVVLDIYSAFRKELREMKTIGVDQIISDYSQFLDSFQWDAIREDRGFDYIFVDELHLFNRQERMLFQKLTRDSKKLPVLLMAYDVKQSPRDTFLGVAAGDAEKYNFWREAKLGPIEKIELQDVFRYTPQITSVLKAVDQSFPVLGLDEEWPSYTGTSKLKDGPIPLAVEVRDETVMYAMAFPRAADYARKLKKGRRVAILCCNHELFDQYASAGTYDDKFLAIRSREQLSELYLAGKKFILSMPEFVAGMQFDTVLMLDVNNGEVPEDGATQGTVRQFVSQIYLGASRAEQSLEIFASRRRGGLSRFLSHALQGPAPVLRKIDASELPKV